MKAVVVDTNVCIVANEGHAPAGPLCVVACIDALLNARDSLVLLDDGYRIIQEYQRYLSFSGQPRAGDAFFKWALGQPL
jgi:hypothetical protein